MNTQTSNPFPRNIHLPTLRRHLFNGSDRIPPFTQAQNYPAQPAADWRGEPIGPFNFRVDPVVIGSGHKPHRIFVECPVCGNWIPAGRASQHGKIHASK